MVPTRPTSSVALDRDVGPTRWRRPGTTVPAAGCDRGTDARRRCRPPCRTPTPRPSRGGATLHGDSTWHPTGWPIPSTPPDTVEPHGRRSATRRSTAATASGGALVHRGRRQYVPLGMRRVVSIAGIRRAEAAMPRSGAGRRGVVRRIASTVAAPAAVTIRYGADPPPVPDRAADIVLPRGRSLARRQTASRPVTRAAPAAGARRPIVVGGGPTGVRRPVRGFRQAVQHALLDALAGHDRHALHAAGLHRDRVTILIFGGSGAGKSTLAYAGAQHGWEVLSDDLCLVHPSGRDRGLGLSEAAQRSRRHVADPDRRGRDAGLTPPAAAPSPSPTTTAPAGCCPTSSRPTHRATPASALVLVGHPGGRVRRRRCRRGPLRVEVVIGVDAVLRCCPSTSAPSSGRGRLSRLPTVRYLHRRRTGATPGGRHRVPRRAVGQAPARASVVSSQRQYWPACSARRAAARARLKSRARWVAAPRRTRSSTTRSGHTSLHAPLPISASRSPLMP